jgi:hypothetical protein
VAELHLKVSHEVAQWLSDEARIRGVTLDQVVTDVLREHLSTDQAEGQGFVEPSSSHLGQPESPTP